MRITGIRKYGASIHAFPLSPLMAKLQHRCMNTALNSPALGEIGQIAITVSDVDLALAFYRDALGLRFLFSAGPQLAFLQAGGVRLMLSTPQGAGTTGANSTLYFRTSDLAASYASLVARGAREESAPHLIAKMPDHEVWMAFVRDPDGNLVGLMQERR